MSRKKKFVIATATVAGIFAVIYVVVHFKKRHELASLTDEERRELKNAMRPARIRFLRELLEREGSELPEDEQNLSWVRTRIREWISNHI